MLQNHAFLATSGAGMSLLEVLTLGVSAVTACGAWLGHLLVLCQVNDFVSRKGGREASAAGLWLLSFLTVGAVMLATLRLLASADVRSSLGWTLFYMLLGYAIAAIGMLGVRLLGLRRSDISERGNEAASTVYFCGIVATVIAFAGANVGDGPGVQVVYQCTLLSVGTLWLLAFAHSAIAHTSYRVAVDRDRAIAFRFGCLMLACALILGRSVAGDWRGLVPMLHDFQRAAWLAPALVIVDLVLGRLALPDEHEAGMPDRIVGVAHVLVAIGYLSWLGMPS
jgi:hypothetical protein